MNDAVLRADLPLIGELDPILDRRACALGERAQRACGEAGIVVTPRAPLVRLVAGAGRSAYPFLA